MNHLAASGTIVFLKIDLGSLEQRVSNAGTRGLAKRPEQSLGDLFTERTALYSRFADLTVNCSGLTQEEVCENIMKAIGR